MSFGAEIRSFIAAYQAGDKIAHSDDDAEYKQLRAQVLKNQLDPENVKLDQDVKRARAARLNRGPDPLVQESRALSNKERQLRIDAYTAAPTAGEPSPATNLPAPMAPRPQSALPVDDNQQMAANPELDDEDGQTPQAPQAPQVQQAGQPQQFAATGGLITPKPALAIPIGVTPRLRPVSALPTGVKHYAAGGTVDEDDTTDDGDDNEADRLDEQDARDARDAPEEPVGAIPSSPTAPVRQAAAEPAEKPKYSPQAAHDAVLDGLRFAQRAHGVDRENTENQDTDISAQSRRQPNHRAYASSVGAATPSDMEKIKKAVDPHNQLSETDRTMAAMAHVYEFHLQQGNVKGAESSAASMVLYYKQVSGRYQALAKAAAEKGELDDTLKYILKAQANIPDGKDLKLVKRPDGSIAYSYNDAATGKPVERGVASPDEILKWATHGDMGDFDTLIDRAGMQRAAAAKEPGAPKVEDRDAWAAKINEVADDPKQVKLDPATAPQIKHTAAQILRANDVLPTDAVGTVLTMTKVGGTPDFKVEPQKNGSVMVTMADGREVKLPKPAYQSIVALRGINQKALDKQGAAAQTAATADAQRQALVKQQADAEAASRPPVRSATPFTPTVRAVPRGPAPTPQQPYERGVPIRKNYVTGEDLVPR